MTYSSMQIKIIGSSQGLGISDSREGSSIIFYGRITMDIIANTWRNIYKFEKKMSGQATIGNRGETD